MTRVCAPGGNLGHFFFQRTKSVKSLRDVSTKNKKTGSAVETAAAEEIEQGGLRQHLLDDFLELLGKASAKKASAFPHLPQPRRRLLMSFG